MKHFRFVSVKKLLGNKIFFKLCLSAFLLGNFAYLVKAVKRRGDMKELESRGIYKDKNEVRVEQERKMLSLNKLLNYKHLVQLHPCFIQLLPSSLAEKEPHFIYYRLLNQVRKSIRKDLSLVYLAEDSVTPENREELLKLLKLEEGKMLRDIQYIISTPDGGLAPVLKGEENSERSRRIIEGVPVINDWRCLGDLLNFPEERVYVLANFPLQKRCKEFFNKIHSNLFFFSQNVFCFLENRTSRTLAAHNSLLFFFNPKFYEIDSFKNLDRDFYLYDKRSEDLTNIRKVEPALLEAFERDKDRFLLCLVYNLANKPEWKIKEDVTLMVNEFVGNANGKATPVPKRVGVTDNAEIANFHKIKFVNKKRKFVFVYINPANLKKQGLDPGQATEFLKGILRRAKVDYLVTHTASIAKSFNVIPRANENLTIRFVDYGKYVLYDKKKNHKLHDTKEPIENVDKNFLFYFKVAPQIEVLSDEGFRKQIAQFEQGEIEGFRQVLETSDEQAAYLGKANSVQSVTGQNFVDKVLKPEGKKIVLSVSDNCLGCVTALTFLSDLSLPEDVQVFQYDTLNECLDFKKVKKVPKLHFYQGDKLVGEMDFYPLMEEHGDDYPNVAAQKIRKNLNI